MQYRLERHPGSTFSADAIDACVSIIRKGGAVDSASAAKNLPKARIVVTVRAGDDIVGVGAIKDPRPHYASKIGKDSGFPFDQEMLELGYVARRESHRGHKLSEQIVRELLAAVSGVPLFATTANRTMKNTLKAAGFAQQENEWHGEKDTLLSLWIRQLESQ